MTENTTSEMETGPEPHPNAGQGEDISPDKDGGVLKFIKVVGDTTEEDRPMKGDKVFVHYVGTLLSGEEFDSSRRRGEKFSFELGEGKVIKAWDIGVATMRRGEIAVLTCKPEYAYGKSGQGKIPPDATLVFEVELFDWKGSDISENSDGSLIKRTLQAGEGPTYEHPNDEATVEIHLCGKYDGRIFDERDLKFVLGEGGDHGVVEGVEQGLKKMNKNEIAQLKMRSKYAFGKKGHSDFNIPPNADVEFKVHLKGYEKVKESWEMDIAEKLEAAALAKEKGTTYFKANKYSVAIKKWSKIITLLELEQGLKDEEKEQCDKLQLAANLNLALVYLKTEDYAEAVKVCNKAIEFDEKSEKGHFRRGQAYFGQRDYEEAKKDFAKVVELAPENNAAKNQLNICNAKIKEQLKKEKRLYQNMFNTIIRENEEMEKQKEVENEKNMKEFPIKEDANEDDAATETDAMKVDGEGDKAQPVEEGSEI